MSYAATSPRNAGASENIQSIFAPISAAFAVNQGDFVIITSNLIALPAAVNATPIGIADMTNPVTSIGGDVNPLSIRVIRKGLVFLKIKNGDTPAFDDALYLSDVDNQTVTTSSANSATKVARCRELSAFTGDGSKLALCEVDFDVI